MRRFRPLYLALALSTSAFVVTGVVAKSVAASERAAIEHDARGWLTRHTPRADELFKAPEEAIDLAP